MFVQDYLPSHHRLDLEHDQDTSPPLARTAAQSTEDDFFKVYFLPSLKMAEFVKDCNLFIALINYLFHSYRGRVGQTNRPKNNFPKSVPEHPSFVLVSAHYSVAIVHTIIQYTVILINYFTINNILSTPCQLSSERYKHFSWTLSSKWQKKCNWCSGKLELWQKSNKKSCGTVNAEAKTYIWK